MSNDTQDVVKEYSAVGFLLRIALGVLFFFAGAGKFIGGYGKVTSYLISDMAEKTWLPSFMLHPYVYSLPFIEVIVGLLLLLGLWTRPILFLTGLLLISLMFGKVLSGDHATAANNANYVLIAAIAYYFNRHNLYSLDALRKKSR